MKKVLEMREKRAKAWDAAKAFLVARAKDGVLSAEDNTTYDKLVADVDAMARQIAIEEDRVARDAAMAEPTSKPSSMPYTKPKPKRLWCRCSSTWQPCTSASTPCWTWWRA